MPGSASTSRSSASGRGGPPGRVRVRDADPELRPVVRLRDDQLDDLLERLLAAADALLGEHLALADREDRLHVQELSGHLARAPDPAAAREELERVDGEE